MFYVLKGDIMSLIFVDQVTDEIQTFSVQPDELGSSESFMSYCADLQLVSNSLEKAVADPSIHNKVHIL